MKTKKEAQMSFSLFKTSHFVKAVEEDIEVSIHKHTLSLKSHTEAAP